MIPLSEKTPVLRVEKLLTNLCRGDNILNCATMPLIPHARLSGFVIASEADRVLAKWNPL